MSGKKRLDVILVERGFFDSRQVARTNIMCGNVIVNGIKITKAGEKIDCDLNIKILDQKETIYVSRAGAKLKKAIDMFEIDLNDKICFDIGASTGGFTDCMLREGSVKIFAIDVGYGQLDYRLRMDERVVVFERMNVRYAEPETFSHKGDFASIDVSFISIEKILNKVRNFLKNDAQIVALIKPQFEAGKGKVNKKGIVKDKEVHFEVIEKIVKFAEANNFKVLNLTYSPIKGGHGNIEFLLHLSVKNLSENIMIDDEFIRKVIDEAHIEQNYN
ncbi:TlyA family RNA methyltransferase [Candidatus Arthromitus sp. SFB-rat-Yit]|uniref:TlyA family RNA methyltransferase n=1 Tax=Candidatus Arthromitus sp. SFB-rat-Yit TaxID=1041504 RepID=UPI000227A6DB|nr:TlyA family RNA methyltransferase [Candidatus Arthromitus sp. SFB-rat-Yit]BAK81114.1 hemolysin A [Candidatus Arthromitus sp. SFB-rat-Yit]